MSNGAVSRHSVSAGDINKDCYVNLLDLAAPPKTGCFAQIHFILTTASRHFRDWMFEVKQ